MHNFKFEFDFTVNKLKQSLSLYDGDVNDLFLIFQDILPKYRITSEPRLAGFIDQFEFKSKGFKNIDSLKPINDVYKRQFATYIKLPADEVNKYSETLVGAIDSAGWYWNINYLNFVVDNLDFNNLTKRVNPGEVVSLRVDNFNRILDILRGKE
jgi:predicted chitinase